MGRDSPVLSISSANTGAIAQSQEVSSGPDCGGGSNWIVRSGGTHCDCDLCQKKECSGRERATAIFGAKWIRCSKIDDDVFSIIQCDSSGEHVLFDSTSLSMIH